MEETAIRFIHFNAKADMDEKIQSNYLKDSDIAFCKETRVIRTHGINFGEFNWSEIPSVTN